MKDHYPPIGFIRSCFTEKFGVPRQSMMISEARAVLKLNPDPSYRVALNHLEQFSHIWVVFVFHQHLQKSWRPTIRPPRIEAPRRVGVFASRSPHRPNPIGLSAVKLDSIDRDAVGGMELHLSGVDIMDGTPVLDIKPYLPFADSITDANSGWAESEITRYPVTFSEEALASLTRFSAAADGGGVGYPRLQQLIAQMLEWDPRPTSQRRAMPISQPETEGMKFAFRILDFDVHWIVLKRAIHVTQVILLR